MEGNFENWIKKKKILLFDGNNLLFRAFFAVKNLQTSTGIPTGGVYGSLVSLRSAVNYIKPNYLIVCWDSGKKTFRHEQDDEYKANRPDAPDDLKVQFALVQETFKRLGIPQMTANGVESDDLVGTLSKMASKLQMKTIIVSSDKDFFQLCEDDLQVYSFAVKNKNGTGIVDAKYVRETFGVEPWQLVEIKALTGERCDNIQGVNGIGPVTATNFIKEHGNVENLLEVLSKKQKLSSKEKTILDSVEIIKNAHSLAKIRCDVEIENIPVKPVEKIICDKEGLLRVFEKLEFKQFITEFSSWHGLFNYNASIS